MAGQSRDTRKEIDMKWIKERNENNQRRGWNNYRSDDGVFFIRQNSQGARWIIKTTDGSEPFSGHRGTRTSVALADNIADAKYRCESVAKFSSE
jgi:hypothetical protein